MATSSVFSSDTRVYVDEMRAEWSGVEWEWEDAQPDGCSVFSSQCGDLAVSSCNPTEGFLALPLPVRYKYTMMTRVFGEANNAHPLRSTMDGWLIFGHLSRKSGPIMRESYGGSKLLYLHNHGAVAKLTQS